MSFAVPESAVFTGHNFSLQIDVGRVIHCSGQRGGR